MTFSGEKRRRAGPCISPASNRPLLKNNIHDRVIHHANTYPYVLKIPTHADLEHNGINDFYASEGSSHFKMELPEPELKHNEL